MCHIKENKKKEIAVKFYVEKCDFSHYVSQSENIHLQL